MTDKKAVKEAVAFLKGKGGECSWFDEDITAKLCEKLLDACFYGLAESDLYKETWKIKIASEPA